MKRIILYRFGLLVAFLITTVTFAFSQAQHNHEANLSVSKDNRATSTKTTAESARAAFEKFTKLNGEWMGRSTKGWEEKVSFRAIAQGSVVVENSFDAHPNETMMTMFYLDQGRLMLTHYCVAKNQPRLVASSFDEDGKTISFTFLDATNLPSRDNGHMDKAVFKFIDENTITTQWTWYQNGKENWMEEIKLQRIKGK
ncbi:MAG: hypothetical protein AB1757_13080 [Acidobacteriota bacterium]